MDEHEQEDFRSFCRQATTHQLFNIIAKEREAKSWSDYRYDCWRIACDVGRERGLTSEM